MKVALVLFLCSYIAETCLEPYPFPTKFEDEYSCLMEGYNQSILKMEEIGREQINKHSMYVKFACVTLEDEDEDKKESQTKYEITRNIY
jgi:hypothetical protein|tara:strand:+ start:170 stop:436 length:267 start_codon:yes stop_codon:yes gene_type:complete